MDRKFSLFMVFAFGLLSACSSGSSGDSSGGQESGGSAAAGNSSAGGGSGGSSAVGGSSAASSAGRSGSAGSSASAGRSTAVDSGGKAGGKGGSAGGGGGAGGAGGSSTGTGGATGGTNPSGGTTTASGGHTEGGAAGGGATGSGGAATTSTASKGGNGGSGGNATGGTSATGGTTSAEVVPTVSGSKYQFSFGDTVLEIDAEIGARVTKLTLDGVVCVQPPATDLTTWGSTFWISPRDSWTPETWPPPTPMDSGPFTGSVSGARASFTGAEDPSMGITMSKTFSVDGASGWITIDYTVASKKAIKAAPWEVTRVPRGGVVLFPTGKAALTKGPWTSAISESGGITFVDDTKKTVSSSDGSKVYGDGSGGWMAYAQGGVLFIKKFTDTPANAQAPGDGEIGVYSGVGFLEYEVQGPYESIAAGGKLPWTVKWRLVKIPSSVTVSPGSATLAEFATEQAAL